MVVELSSPLEQCLPFMYYALLTQGKTTCLAAQWDEDAINVGVDVIRMLVK